jgi:hypothetical protein
MTADREDSILEHDLGTCSPQKPFTNSNVQYLLHSTENTTFCFTIFLEDLHFNVQVTFKPFHRTSCSFTYHEYEILCLVPPNLPQKIFDQSRSSIIIILQQLYDRHILKNAGYRFRFLEKE